MQTIIRTNNYAINKSDNALISGVNSVRKDHNNFAHFRADFFNS